MATIFDDDYHTNDLLADGCNVKLLMEFRKARPRFFDAVLRAELLRKFSAEMTGDGAWSLTFDGVDRRGADRGIGVPREAGVLSSDDAFWQPLLTRAEPIGEGDLKLTDATQRVRSASRVEGSPGARRGAQPRDHDRHRLVCHRALQQNRRERRAEEADRDEMTVLCLKERAAGSARAATLRPSALHVLRHAELPRADPRLLLRHAAPERRDEGAATRRARALCRRPRFSAAATLSRSRASAPTLRCRSCARSCESTPRIWTTCTACLKRSGTPRSRPSRRAELPRPLRRLTRGRALAR